MAITEQLQRAQASVTLPDDLRKAVDLRRDLERQGMVRPPQTPIIPIAPKEPEGPVKVFYR